jgi:hypothetical protein
MHEFRTANPDMPKFKFRNGLRTGINPKAAAVDKPHHAQNIQ